MAYIWKNYTQSLVFTGKDSFQLSQGGIPASTDWSWDSMLSKLWLKGLLKRRAGVEQGAQLEGFRKTGTDYFCVFKAIPYDQLQSVSKTVEPCLWLLKFYHFLLF